MVQQHVATLAACEKDKQAGTGYKWLNSLQESHEPAVRLEEKVEMPVLFPEKDMDRANYSFSTFLTMSPCHKHRI